MARAYPTAEDLKRFLAAQNLVTVPPDGDAALLDYDLAIEEAIREMELRCGNRRFVPVTATRRFNPPVNRVLDLEDDLLSVTSFTWQPEGSPAETLVEGEDYVLGPYNAAGRGQPYQYAEINRRYLSPLGFANRRALRITGSWGYGTDVPAPIWNGILRLGLLQLLPEISLLVTGGMIGWTEANVTEQYGVKPFETIQTRLETRVGKIVALYRRKTFV